MHVLEIHNLLEVLFIGISNVWNKFVHDSGHVLIEDRHNSWLYCFTNPFKLGIRCESETRVPSLKGFVKQYNQDLCMSSKYTIFWNHCLLVFQKWNKFVCDGGYVLIEDRHNSRLLFHNFFKTWDTMRNTCPKLKRICETI